MTTTLIDTNTTTRSSAPELLIEAADTISNRASERDNADGDRLGSGKTAERRGGMSREKLTAIGSLEVGCLVRVATDDPTAEVEGTVTSIRRCDGGVMMTFKGADQQERTQHVAVAVLGPLLHNWWGGYDITILRSAPMQQSISGMRPA